MIRRTICVLMATAQIVFLLPAIAETQKAISASDDLRSDNYLLHACQSGLARWPKSRMPVKVMITPGADIPHYKPAFASILRDAFEKWVKASSGRIEIRYTEDAKKADMSCTWTNDVSKMMMSQEGGHAVVIPDQQGIIRSNIILLTSFNAKEPLTDDQASRIALHEVGHALGILGHSRNPADIMFAATLSNDVKPVLSRRDVNTLITLYDLEQAQIASRQVDASKIATAGDVKSPVMQCIRLNTEAVEAMKKKNFSLAMEKLQAAHDIDPQNDVINGNLGSMYCNMAALFSLTGNFTQAEMCLKKAISLLEESSNRPNLISALKNYVIILRVTKRTLEAQAIDARIHRLESGK